MIDNPEQRSIDWYRKRLGNFTGSRVSELMGKGRKKDEAFSQTALSYIGEIASERLLMKEVIEDDELFQQYCDQVCVVNRAMQWGIENEVNARLLYEEVTGRRVVEVSSVRHGTLPHFASSPDGFHYDEDSREKGVIEIKCPSLKQYVNYASNISGNASLLTTEPKYYWQCIAHMMCVDAQWCDFVAYNPFAVKCIHIARITRDEDAIAQLGEKIRLADEKAEEIIKQFNTNHNYDKTARKHLPE